MEQRRVVRVEMGVLFNQSRCQAAYHPCDYIRGWLSRKSQLMVKGNLPRHSSIRAHLETASRGSPCQHKQRQNPKRVVAPDVYLK